MFAESKAFMSDISSWNVSPNTRLREIFYDIPYFSIDFMPGLNDKKIFLTKDGQKCKIRQAALEDAQFIAEGINAGVDNKANLEALKKLVRTEDTLYYFRNVLIAEIDGKPVGCVVSYTGEFYKDNFKNTWSNQKFCEQAKEFEYHIDTIYVAPEYRKLSIANHLFDMAITVGKMVYYDFCKFSLVVMPGKPYLVNFYEKHGFQDSGTRNLWGTPYILMTRKLR